MTENSSARDPRFRFSSKTFGRRSFLAGAALVGGSMLLASARALAEAIEKLTLSEDEWRKRLTPEQFGILREEKTEHAFSSPLYNEHRKGVFQCAGCDLPLFTSEMKYDSGTGWPSFFNVIEGHVETRADYKLIWPRTEYHCARCSGHHGHVFEDGPQPTGLRYCNNGAVLKFVPAEPEKTDEAGGKM